MAQRYTIQAVIYPGDESGYVAECLNLAVVTQGQTLDETVQNLREALHLHLEGEDLAEKEEFPYYANAEVMTLGQNDIRKNWRRYREQYERELKRQR
ncbi:MAG: type II toxin-antitoxin system HicB family antitoxin [Anaerolineae bacterium]